MKIIITENQLFLFRRIQDFIDIVEDQIDGYETHEENFLNKISHMTHAHYDPNTQHLGISFPNLGKQHNMTFDLGFGLNSHKETHGDDHGHSQLSSLTPHSVFDFGVKIPFNKLFN